MSGRTPLENNARVENTTLKISPTDAPTDLKVIRKEMSEFVREYVDRLPPDHWMVLILKELDNGCDFYQNDEGTLACNRKPILIESKMLVLKLKLRFHIEIF